MANNTFTCAGCQQRTSGLKYSYNGRSYCYDCYNKLLKSLEQTNQQKQHLYNYIKELYGIQEIPVEIINMLDHELSVGRKLKGIEYTLYYYSQIEGNTLGAVTSLYFIIRDYYEAAHKYVVKMKEQQKKNEQVNLDIAPRIIRLKRSDLKTSNRHANSIKYNIEDL